MSMWRLLAAAILDLSPHVCFYWAFFFKTTFLLFYRCHVRFLDVMDDDLSIVFRYLSYIYASDFIFCTFIFEYVLPASFYVRFCCDAQLLFMVFYEDELCYISFSGHLFLYIFTCILLWRTGTVYGVLWGWFVSYFIFCTSVFVHFLPAAFYVHVQADV